MGEDKWRRPGGGAEDGEGCCGGDYVCACVWWNAVVIEVWERYKYC